MTIDSQTTTGEIDLQACEDEPIHVPGAVQRRGVLLVVDDGVVVQVSDNLRNLLGVPVEEAVGHPLAAVLGEDAASNLRLPQTQPGGPLGDALQQLTMRGRDWLVATHLGTDGSVLVEAEPLPRAEDDGTPVATVFQQAHAVLREAAGASTVEEIYELAARGVRRLTGFDRVMMYRFDRDYNGQVVAEDRRDDLEPYLGLHYPASDIPAQARALYEKNLIRLISDTETPTARLVPPLHPRTGAPTDLTYSTLRAVSPVHVQYLRNMGVSSSMSISLLDDGRLWGMVACHHVSGPHTPSLEVRAGTETLAAGLSLQAVVRAAADRARHAQTVADELRRLTGLTDDVPLAQAVAQRRLLELLDTDGLMVRVGGTSAAVGVVPPDPAAVVRALREQEDGSAVADTSGLRACDALAAALPDHGDLGEVAGALVVPLPDGDSLALFRREVTREVAWGGNPEEKPLTIDDDGVGHLGPRRSFSTWQQVVRGTSRPWSAEDVEAAAAVRRLVVEMLYRRTRPDLGAALALQRSSLPQRLPQPDGWQVTARYRPADGGKVGGDWYDSFELASGRVALVVGDVAGHGLAAASSMNQLRNGLRSLLVAHDGAAGPALEALDRLAKQLLPGEMATLWVGVLDPATGTVDYVSAGHLAPLLVRDGEARFDKAVRNPPLGFLRGRPDVGTLTLRPGESLLVFSDGLVEQRRAVIMRRLEELRTTAAVTLDLEVLEHRMTGLESGDDATMLLVTAAPLQE
ncbi:light-regulated signal transduction histidine kinase (bacteriophytochrome) [Georgenia soli]|uniref:Light-regulated signal transduction histidine kinase (Bacteriophytochrome) n=1 Tax=Georgenia soli TaxID=638953 RepID=A0A2A9ERA5_9MICO|nr:SpoIIE family protein phosphatase [Georgenia soli]PFG41061.1 light-regulated signal transduction histidine kinase (bacteriophytochrome) [Georgenia soli]